MRLILIFPLISILSSCNNQKLGDKNIHREYYKDGTLKSEIKVRNGIKDGIAIFYYPSGMISNVGNYKNGVADGPMVTFYDTTGKVMLIDNLKHEISQGVVYRFFSSGYLKSIENFNADTLCGTMTHFYDKMDKIHRVIPEINSHGRSAVFVEYDTLDNPTYYKGLPN